MFSQQRTKNIQGDRNRQSRLSALLMGIVFLSLANTPAQALPLYDDFNDNALNASLWQQKTYGAGVAVAEANQRL